MPYRELHTLPLVMTNACHCLAFQDCGYGVCWVLQARIFAEDADAAPKILHDWPALMDASLKVGVTMLAEGLACAVWSWQDDAELARSLADIWAQWLVLQPREAFASVGTLSSAAHPSVTVGSRRTMQAWGTDLGELRQVFEEERNAWMDGEEAEWLGLVQQNVVSTLQYTEVHTSCCLSHRRAAVHGATEVLLDRVCGAWHALRHTAATNHYGLDTRHTCAAAVLHRKLQGAAPRQPGSREAAGARPAVAVLILWSCNEHSLPIPYAFSAMCCTCVHYRHTQTHYRAQDAYVELLRTIDPQTTTSLDASLS